MWACRILLLEMLIVWIVYEKFHNTSSTIQFSVFYFILFFFLSCNNFSIIGSTYTMPLLDDTLHVNLVKLLMLKWSGIEWGNPSVPRMVIYVFVWWSHRVVLLTEKSLAHSAFNTALCNRWSKFNLGCLHPVTHVISDYVDFNPSSGWWSYDRNM
jgi:hypothetical protein